MWEMLFASQNLGTSLESEKREGINIDHNPLQRKFIGAALN